MPRYRVVLWEKSSVWEKRSYIINSETEKNADELLLDVKDGNYKETDIIDETEYQTEEWDDEIEELTKLED